MLTKLEEEKYVASSARVSTENKLYFFREIDWFLYLTGILINFTKKKYILKKNQPTSVSLLL